MNLLDQLICRLNTLIEIIDELVKSIETARNNKDFSKTELRVLNETIKKTLDLSKSFMENYNEFLTIQIEIDKFY